MMQAVASSTSLRPWRVATFVCSLLACYASAQKCANGTLTVKDWLEASPYPTGKALSTLVDSNFNGTVFVPTNEALIGTFEALLKLAAGDKKDTEYALPSDANLTQILIESFPEVLKLHIVPNTPLDPKAFSASDFTKGSFSQDNISTLLSTQDKSTYCPSTPTKSMTLEVTATGTSGTNLTGAHVMAPGAHATAKEITAKGVCPGVIHVIDTVLQACNASQSNLTEVVKTIAEEVKKSSAAGLGVRSVVWMAVAAAAAVVMM